MLPSIKEITENTSFPPNYIIVIYRGMNEIVHMVSYENQPTEDDISHLAHELHEEPEFGLQDIFHELQFAVMTKEEYDICYKQAMLEAEQMGSGSIH